MSDPVDTEKKTEEIKDRRAKKATNGNQQYQYEKKTEHALHFLKMTLKRSNEYQS